MDEDRFFGGPDAFDDDDPALAFSRLGRLSGLIRRIAWFSQVGTPLDRQAIAFADNYLQTLGFPHASVASLDDWQDAALAAQTFDHDSPAWDSEEQLRASLTEAALERHDEDALAAAFDAIAAVVAPVAADAAQDLADRLGIDDEAFLEAAVGAVVQACHQAALVLLAGGDQTDMAQAGVPFAWRFRLFEAGRWPLGIAGSSFTYFERRTRRAPGDVEYQFGARAAALGRAADPSVHAGYSVPSGNQGDR